MHPTIPKGIVGGFEFSVFQRNLKELARKAMEMCLRVLKESNKSRFDSYSRQEQCIDHIPYYLSGLSRAHFFPTTFLEIAVSLLCSWRHLEISEGLGRGKKKKRAGDDGKGKNLCCRGGLSFEFVKVCWIRFFNWESFIGFCI